MCKSAKVFVTRQWPHWDARDKAMAAFGCPLLPLGGDFRMSKVLPQGHCRMRKSAKVFVTRQWPQWAERCHQNSIAAWPCRMFFSEMLRGSALSQLSAVVLQLAQHCWHHRGINTPLAAPHMVCIAVAAHLRANNPKQSRTMAEVMMSSPLLGPPDMRLQPTNKLRHTLRL